MATRIAHISDLHFPAKSTEQVGALARSVSEMAPNLVLVTGDLTRSGKKEEFRQAQAFVGLVNVPTLVLPGNHDIPIPGIFARMHAPFRRFERYFPGMPSFLETADLIVVGLNTAVGWQPRLDWSLGYVVPDRLNRAASILRARRGDRVGIVAGHHPLHQHAADPVRSRTFGGHAAFDRLSGAGMNLFLHGHLHRTDCRCFERSGVPDASEICANTALANRERSGPAGYNIIDVENHRWQLTVMSWKADHYETQLIGAKA